MRILVVNGDCLRVNSSANLCHLAYIKGLVSTGHEVHLLCADGDGYEIDPTMKIPSDVHCHAFFGMSFYERVSMKKKQYKKIAEHTDNHSSEKRRSPIFSNMIKKLKITLLSLYGPHGIYASFVRKARRFKYEAYFDLIISLSTPPSSHLLTHELISSGHVKAGCWIQIWEDPWYDDAYGFNRKKSVLLEEKRLLGFADKICYVSPVTLRKQRLLFPESSAKMFWEPVPTYYIELNRQIEPQKKLFGYFGDYSLPARDILPFYNVAEKTGICVNICGQSNLHLSDSDTIKIYPRLSLEDLKPFENKTDVLVFLCNRHGGQIPGKIYQYAATSKTILFILDGTPEERRELLSFFYPFHRFVFCENSEEDIERAIYTIINDKFDDISNLPLFDFMPEKIVRRIIDKGMNG